MGRKLFYQTGYHRPVRRWVLCLGVLFVACLPFAFARVDQSTLKARVYYLGDISFPPNKLIVEWLLAEPKFSMAIVPCDTYFIPLPQAKKMTRLYLPRTHDDLNSSSDVVILHDIPPSIVGNRVLGFIQSGIERDGIGLGLISYMFWGGGAGTNNIEVWKTLEFYEVFPADIAMNDYPCQMGRTYWSVVRKDPILDLPEIEKQPMQTLGNHGGDIWPRPGTVVHAVWKGRKTPVLVTGSYGSGRTLQLGQGWHNPPKEVFSHYRYMPDLIYNQVYFIADVSPPDDLELAHRTREMFFDARVRKTVTISTMEFADKFGADLGKVEEKLAGLSPLVHDAERQYLSGDYELASETLKAVMEAYPSIEEEVTKLKNRAMLWIYFSEWAAVASTSIICGVVIWTLMVRRRLYRIVNTTKLASRQDED